MKKSTIGAAMAVTLAALGTLAAPNAAQARDYPICARQGGERGYENCGYDTMAQCRAAVSGVGGGCVQNGWYRGPVYGYAQPRTYRKKRAYRDR